MKKILSIAMALAMMLSCIALFASCAKEETIIVHTNAFFAPFEYYDGTEIKGVDVEIMNLVGEKLDKKVEFVNVEFSAIIDNVKAGEVCDAGAAGITITNERKDKVDFSIPYYTSVQYVIFTSFGKHSQARSSALKPIRPVGSTPTVKSTQPKTTTTVITAFFTTPTPLS